MSTMQKERLIYEVEQRPAIWNKWLKEHRDRVLLNMLWDEIAQIVGIEKDECKKYWKNLVDQFRCKYYGIMNKQNQSGAPEIEGASSEIRWLYFKQMLFMKEMFAKRSTFSIGNEPMDETAMNHIGSMDNPEIESFVDTVSAHGARRSAPSGSAVSSISNVESGSQPKTFQRAPRPRLPKTAGGKITSSSSFVQHLDVIGRELRQKDDSPRAFGEYLSHCLRKVPNTIRNDCERKLLEVVNSYIDGKRVMIVDADTHS